MNHELRQINLPLYQLNLIRLQGQSERIRLDM